MFGNKKNNRIEDNFSREKMFKVDVGIKIRYLWQKKKHRFKIAWKIFKKERGRGRNVNKENVCRRKVEKI